MALRSNYSPLDSTLRYDLRMLEGDDWVYMSSDDNSAKTKLETSEESNEGTITFDGYWYTKGFREQLEKRYTGEDVLPFTEIFETPVKMRLSYSKWASEPSEVKKVKESTFWSHRLKAEGEEDREVNEYTFPLLEGIQAEIEVYKREVYEDTSGEGFEDEEVGRIILTPTYMNKLWFRFVSIEWAKDM
jgi:hypothetical protein